MPQSLVRKFHAAFGHPAPAAPSLVPDARLIRLRMTLVREEFDEVMAEFGKLLALNRATGTGKLPAEAIQETYQNLLKELSDLRYVVDGAAIAIGLPIEDAFEEVHRSNMSKLGRDGKPVVREDGKVLKGPDYKEADMKQFVPDIIEGDSDDR